MHLIKLNALICALLAVGWVAVGCLNLTWHRAVTGHIPYVACDRPSLVTAAAVDPDNASILVAGGGGIALDVTRKLKDAGAWVWMLQRSDSRRAEIEGMMALVVKVRTDALLNSRTNALCSDAVLIVLPVRQTLC